MPKMTRKRTTVKDSHHENNSHIQSTSRVCRGEKEENKHENGTSTKKQQL
jgi:hypothetical protein